jgi:hypothetical protein
LHKVGSRVQAPVIRSATTGPLEAPVHSNTTEASLLTRISEVTGHGLPHWFACLDSGPGQLCPEERARWLADEHTLPAVYADALVREHDLRRAVRR